MEWAINLMDKNAWMYERRFIFKKNAILDKIIKQALRPKRVTWDWSTNFVDTKYYGHRRVVLQRIIGQSSFIIQT